ncbi:Hypothetical protein, putative [Bodo saltans]|uniref:Uncharacterized protein n=1 Tax=Bodo saltans TaxID=75058 RepID=A0A0S4J816_BODSA|nr:Hypothetical protein, putative [Bodo saltans]|eukprot:CUG87581.1 Hypothetical protein, putative [Bodo saltans]
MCVANPCVVKAVICDASHREVAHASMVVSHDEHRNSLDDEMWSTFHAASDQAPRDLVANLYSLFKVISSGEDDNMVERTTLLHLRGISGLVTSHSSHSPTVLFFRTVSQSGGTVYETRSFRPPDRSKQGSYRTLDGGSFAIPVATPCAIELWSKEVRSGRLTQLAQSTVALEGDDDSYFWIPFRQLSSPAGVLTRQSPELSQVIAAVKATRETHSRWVTGAALTFLRLCVASGDVGDNALNNLVVEVDVHCRDHSSVVSKSLKVIYPRDGATGSSSFGTLMQSLTLPSNVVAVSSMRIFHELLSGEKLLLGQAPSLTGSADAALPWTMSSIATYTIPLLQGDGVPTRYSLVVTNALGASNSDVDARSVVGVTMHAESVTLNSFDGDGAISVRLSFGSAGKAALPVVIPLRRVSSQHFVPVNNDGIDESFTKKAFARGTMTCELVENTTIVGSVTVRSDVFQNASGCAELTFTSGQRTVGTVQWRYSLRLHEVQKKPRKKPSAHNQSLQQMPPRGASSSAAPIVLQLVGVSAGDISDSCDVVVHMQRASSDETLCVSRFEVREPLSRSLETDEAIGGKMTTYGRFQLRSSTDKSEVRLSLWRAISRQNELVFCGCAAVRRDSIEQSISATSRGSPGIFNVAIMHNGTPEGTARLRAFDHVTFDTHVLRRMCVLVKCVSATGLSHGQRIVVEFKDDNGTVKQERIFLDESSMVSVGPFRSVKEATMNIFVENPITIGLQHLPSSSPQKSSSHTIDIAQRLTSQMVDSQLPPVLNVSFTLPMGEMSSSSVVALAMQLFVSCGDDVISELSHRRTSQHRASGPRASPLLKHQRSVTPLHEQCDNAIATSLSLAQLASEAPSDFAVLEVPTLAQTRPAEKVVVWKDLAVFVGGSTSTPSEGRDLHMFDAASLIWKSYSQPVHSDQHLVKGHGRENSAFVAHRGCAVVRCGDGLLVDGGFGPGGLDPSLSQFTGRYESVRSVYQISSASGASTKQYEAVADGYIDQTSVCSLKDARAHHRGWRVLRTRGAGKSPRSDHTLVRVEESLVIAFGGFTVQILERVMPFGSTEAAIEDPALQVGDERFSYLNSILTVDGDSAQLSGFDQRRQAGRGIVRNESEKKKKDPALQVGDERFSYLNSIITVDGDSAQLSGFNQRRQAGRGIVRNESEDAPHLQRRSKQCRTYEAQENLCNDLRCLNLDTLEWSLLQPMIPGDEGDDEGIHRGYTSTTRSHANSSIPSLLDGSILPSKSFERVALPQPSAGHIAEFIPQSRCMVVFGGLQQSSSNSDSCLVASADLSILKVDALQWFSCKRRAVPGEWPSARFGHSSTLMPNHDILIFGGAARTELPHDVGALPPHELLWRLSLADDAHMFERILLPTTVPITSRFQAAICFIPTEEGTNTSTYSEGTLVIGSGLLLTGMISDTSTTSQHKTTPSSINRFASLRHRSMVEDVKGVPTRPLALMMSLANKPVSL